MSEWKVTGDQIYPKGDNPFGNRFFGYRSTSLELPDGRPAIYHGVTIEDIVHAVPIEDDMTTYLILQPRPNARRLNQPDVPRILELPGGVLNPVLGHTGSVELEMRQEISRTASTITQLGVLLPSPGVSNERDTIFMATGLSIASDPTHDEATEQDLIVIDRPFGELFDSVRNGREPVSAQTVAALAMAATRL